MCVLCVCVGGGRYGKRTPQQVNVFLYAAVIDKYPWGARACEICKTMALSIL